MSDDLEGLIELTPVQRDVIEKIGVFYEGQGVPRIGGRIFGLMLMTQGPISADTIAQTLQVSRSSVSTNIRFLLIGRLVEKVSRPGDRCDYYVYSASAAEQAILRHVQVNAPLRTLVDEALKALGGRDPAREQLEEMAELLELVDEYYEKLLAEWRARKAKRRGRRARE